MRIIIGALLLIMLMLSPAIWAQAGDAPCKSPELGGFMVGPDGEMGLEVNRPTGQSPHGHNRWSGKKRKMGPGGRDAGLQFKQFRKEVRDLGHEIRENMLMVQSLEEELATMEPGITRAEVRKKLNECRLREAELQMELARKRVDFTRRARDMAQKRYDQARLAMERVKEKLKMDYPDLATQLDPDMNLHGLPGPNPEF